jgi:transposase-like protein
MANVLSLARRCQIIKALVEGNSIRSTARLLKADKETVMGLGLTVGLACFKLHDKHVKGLHSDLLEVDECWAYVGIHEKRKGKKHPRAYGDAYTFFAIDNETKVVPSFYTGKRSLASATRFMKDLRKRVRGKPQISVDGWPCWAESVLRAFGLNGVHLGSMVKEYQKRKGDGGGDRNYRPNRVKSTTRTVIFGEPDKSLISTAIAERLNMTTRMTQRRLTRLTNAFSKKQRNLRAAVALHFFHYNFVREHETLGTTPAVAAGLAKHAWTMEELVTAALEEARRPRETLAA